MGSVRSGADCGRMSATDGRATHDYSRGFSPSPGPRAGFAGLRRLLLASALLGGILLVAADASTLYSVAVVTVIKATVTGHAQHSYGLALVGLAAVGLVVGAARGSRAAVAGLPALGLAALLIAAIAGDFHDVHSSGQVGLLYDGATASPGPGFYFETLGALLLIVAGVGLLLLPRARDRPTPAAAVDGVAAGGGDPDPDPGALRPRVDGARLRPTAGAASTARPPRPAPPPRRRPRPVDSSAALAPPPPADSAPPPPSPSPPASDPDDWFAS